ncbi:lamin tail domain-containing protein [Hymenobacter aerilatus]|uniref:Lamin tail domain-containing protein n=1 Tax=Hymenobacter aerilatus TaxID=2932251 RepID=A0A8T9SSY9_9BACT|nr:lamin tail domain-containing protein [Hymenobacter aerilatus]UOR05258.1 lamin tail domain-containing protein [Hymenobacter aerilatus]
MKLYLLLAALLLTLSAHAQLSESFADGDFTQNPLWTGDAAGFVINAQKQLQTNGPAVTGTQLQLVTPCQAVTGTTWEFWVNIKNAVSSGNYADVWLVADRADLKTSGTQGYFVRLGGTPKEVALFRKNATGSPAYVVDGQDNTLTSSTNNLVRVRVTRSVQNVWTLERDLTGGHTFTTEGTGTDATHQRGGYVGVVVTYSSANSQKYFFTDFRVTDTAPPTPMKAAATAIRQFDVMFNEPVAPGIGATSFRLVGAGAPAILSAERDVTDPVVVHLTCAANLPLGSNTVEVRQVADLYGNAAVGPLTVGFVNNGFAVAPALNQVLITEILANETPVVGLPASEYVEVHNPSATAVLDLAGVRLLKPGSTGNPAVFPAGAVLLPGEYAVVCGNTRAGQFAGIGKVFGLTNFPSLTNAGDQLVLRSRTGQTLFEISYSDTWYKDATKKNGGWALEMVDTANPCAGLSNWTASQDPSGGTPGRANSVRATNPDQTPPALLRALATSPTTIRLYFGEKLDSAAVSNAALYALSAGVTITRAIAVPHDFQAVDLTLGTALQPNQPLTVTVQRAVDCVGNATGTAATATFALPGTAAPGDVVVNEILFNPRTYAVDFVELLNRSDKYLDVQGWTLSNHKPDGTLDTKPVTAAPYVLAPRQLVVLTERPDIVQAQYPTSHDAAAFLKMSALPTYPDDAGIVSVSSATGVLLDRYAYDKGQHLALLSDLDGVSLERIRADGPSVAGNFHSAASAMGYATPGRTNSQYQDDPGGDKLFRLEPEVFTPDEDGQQDFTTLNYQLDQPGYVITVTVYDAQGRLTRRLVRNETLPLSGFVQWDGLTDQGRKAPVGAYIMLIELLHPASGSQRQYKKTVVVGARM